MFVHLLLRRHGPDNRLIIYGTMLVVVLQQGLKKSLSFRSGPLFGNIRQNVRLDL